MNDFLTHDQALQWLHEAPQYLSAEQRAELTAHLAECDSCRIYADQLSALQPVLTRALHTRRYPSTLSPGKVQTILQRKRGKVVRRHAFAMVGTVVMTIFTIIVITVTRIPGQAMTTGQGVWPVPDNGPLTILLMGLDTADRSQWNTSRTDVIMLVTIDPSKQTAAVLSVSRDLYVSLPDLGQQNRISTAYFIGETRQSSGGPRYAERTITENLNVPVQRYAVIDFEGFIKVVDAVGGVDVEVPHEVIDTDYPTVDGRTETLRIPAGRIHMDGALALKYVRTRQPNGDFERQHRNHQILLAIRTKALEVDAINRIPEFWTALGNSIQTDLALPEILALAKAWSEIPKENIHRYYIDETTGQPYLTPEQQLVLQPNANRISEVVAKFLGHAANAQKLAPLAPTAVATPPLDMTPGDQSRFELPWTADIVHCVTQNHTAQGHGPGLDFDLARETVLAPQDGIVTFAGWNAEGGGNTISIAHANHLTSTFMHLSLIAVKVGDQVRQGQPIGVTGDTGQVTGPRLHFQLENNGSFVDPIFVEAGHSLKEGDCVTSQNTPFSAGPDRFEPNNDFDQAQPIELNVKYDKLNFVLSDNQSSDWDNDFFKVRVKIGMTITCQTLDLAPVTDTNLILYDQNLNGITGNDDVNRAAGDKSSNVTYAVTTEGWFYVLVGEGLSRTPAEAQQATYTLECLASE